MLNGILNVRPFVLQKLLLIHISSLTIADYDLQTKSCGSELPNHWFGVWSVDTNKRPRRKNSSDKIAQKSSE